VAKEEENQFLGGKKDAAMEKENAGSEKRG